MRRIALMIVMSIAAHRAPACEIVVAPPTQFPPAPDSIVFMGVVTGYHVAHADVRGVHDPSGLALKVVDILTHSRVGTVVEVYPLDTGQDCQPVAEAPDEIRAQYPIGATVSVVGTIVALSPAGGPTVNVVATQADELGHIARVPQAVPRGREGYLDFRAYQDPHEESDRSKAERSAFEDYEFLRCLAALAPTAGGVKSSEMLESLVFYSRYRGVSRDVATASYQSLLKWAGISGSERARLMHAFERANERSGERGAAGR